MNRRQVTAVLFVTAQAAMLTIVETNNSEKVGSGKSHLTSVNAGRCRKVPERKVLLGK
jgi:hypothetical protein